MTSLPRISNAEVALANGLPYRPYIQFICLTTGLSIYLRNGFINKIPFISIPIIGVSYLASHILMNHLSETSLLKVIEYEENRCFSEDVYFEKVKYQLEEKANQLRQKDQKVKEELAKMI